MVDRNKKGGNRNVGLRNPLSANPPEKSEQSVSHDNLATLGPQLSSSENDAAKLQKEMIRRQIGKSIFEKEGWAAESNCYT